MLKQNLGFLISFWKSMGKEPQGNNLKTIIEPKHCLRNFYYSQILWTLSSAFFEIYTQMKHTDVYICKIIKLELRIAYRTEYFYLALLEVSIEHVIKLVLPHQPKLLSTSIVFENPNSFNNFELTGEITFIAFSNTYPSVYFYEIFM